MRGIFQRQTPQAPSDGFPSDQETRDFAAQFNLRGIVSFDQAEQELCNIQAPQSKGARERLAKLLAPIVALRRRLNS